MNCDVYPKFVYETSQRERSEKRKYPVGSSTVGENDLLMPELSGEIPHLLVLKERQQSLK